MRNVKYVIRPYPKGSLKDIKENKIEEDDR
jgi:hypothetical protein